MADPSRRRAPQSLLSSTPPRPRVRTPTTIVILPTAHAATTTVGMRKRDGTRARVMAHPSDRLGNSSHAPELGSRQVSPSRDLDPWEGLTILCPAILNCFPKYGSSY